MTTSTACHYATLGVSRHASAADIKKAFKQKALELHPDKNPNGEAAFKRVNVAYSVLSNTEQKRQYDASRHREEAAARTAAAPPSYGPTSSTTGYSARAAAPNHTSYNDKRSNRDFINKIIREDKDTQSAKQNASFGTWYRKQQTEWESTERQMKEAEGRRRAEQAAEDARANARAERLREIERDLEKQREQSERQRAAQQRQEEERLERLERKRQVYQDEIEREEAAYKEKFRNLERKWDQAPNANTGSTVKVVQKMKQDREGTVLEQSLDDSLAETRRQRAALKQEVHQHRAEAAELQRQAAAAKAGDFGFGLHAQCALSQDEGGPQGVASHIFEWGAPTSARGKPSRSVAEELLAARAELEAAEQGQDWEPTGSKPAASRSQSKAASRSSSREPRKIDDSVDISYCGDPNNAFVA